MFPMVPIGLTVVDHFSALGGASKSDRMLPQRIDAEFPRGFQSLGALPIAEFKDWPF